MEKETMIHEHHFQHHGTAYTVRVIKEADRIRVGAFKGEEPANEFSYSITRDVHDDSYVYHGDAVPHLVRVAISDISGSL